jgi:hypothetical protein
MHMLLCVMIAFPATMQWCCGSHTSSRCTSLSLSSRALPCVCMLCKSRDALCISSIDNLRSSLNTHHKVLLESFLFKSACYINSVCHAVGPSQNGTGSAAQQPERLELQKWRTDCEHSGKIRMLEWGGVTRTTAQWPEKWAALYRGGLYSLDSEDSTLAPTVHNVWSTNRCASIPAAYLGNSKPQARFSMVQKHMNSCQEILGVTHSRAYMKATGIVWPRESLPAFPTVAVIGSLGCPPCMPSKEGVQR